MSNTYPSKDTEMKLVIDQDYQTEILDTIIAFAKSNAVASYIVSDSCLFVVNRYAHYSSNGQLYNSFTELFRNVK